MLNKLRDEVHQNAIEHGWWEKEFKDHEIDIVWVGLNDIPELRDRVVNKLREDRHFGSLVALMHSELSETLEEFRDGKPLVYYSGKDASGCREEMDKPFPPIIMKPEGIAIELADCIIRILDYCGKEGIDIDEAIRVKHEYNKTRPYRHGGKKI